MKIATNIQDVAFPLKTTAMTALTTTATDTSIAMTSTAKKLATAVLAI